MRIYNTPTDYWNYSHKTDQTIEMLLNTLNMSHLDTCCLIYASIALTACFILSSSKQFVFLNKRQIQPIHSFVTMAANQPPNWVVKHFKWLQGHGAFS